MVRGGLRFEGDLSGIYLGRRGDDNVLVAFVSDSGPKPELEEEDDPASDEDTFRNAFTSH